MPVSGSNEFDRGAKESGKSPLAGSLPPHRIEPLRVPRCEITRLPQRAGIGNCAGVGYVKTCRGNETWIDSWEL